MPRRSTAPALLSVAAFLAAAAGLVTSGSSAAPGNADARNAAADRVAPPQYAVFIGTYTSGANGGVHVCKFDGATGEITKLAVAPGADNPSFLAVHPSGRHLYAVSEMPKVDGKPGGAVAAFEIVDAGKGVLKFLNREFSGGSGPCHVSVDRTGKCVVVANYGGGSVASLPVAEDGSLKGAGSIVQHAGSSVNKGRQSAPHAHSINVSADGKFAVAADLGLDKVLVYKLDVAAGTLAANDPPSASVAPGSGPRHFAFHPGGKLAFVINEMTCTLTSFRWDGDKGTLTEVHTITTLPDGKVEKGYSTAEVVVHPSGKWVYGSNRGHNTIAVFAVDADTGKLTPAGHVSTEGRTPRNFAVDPTGRWLLAANQDSNTVHVFAIDATTGLPKSTGKSVEIPKPVCVRFLRLQ